MEDYYALLGVPANAPPSIIRRARRKLLIQLHRQGVLDLEARMRLLKEAVDVLGEPERRRHYDEALRVHRAQTRHEAKLLIAHVAQTSKHAARAGRAAVTANAPVVAQLGEEHDRVERDRAARARRARIIRVAIGLTCFVAAVVALAIAR